MELIDSRHCGDDAILQLPHQIAIQREHIDGTRHVANHKMGFVRCGWMPHGTKHRQPPATPSAHHIAIQAKTDLGHLPVWLLCRMMASRSKSAPPPCRNTRTVSSKHTETK